MSCHTCKVIKELAEALSFLLLFNFWFLLLNWLSNWSWCSYGCCLLLLFDSILNNILSGDWMNWCRWYWSRCRGWSCSWLLFGQNLLYRDFDWCRGLGGGVRSSDWSCWWNYYGDLNLLWSFLGSSCLLLVNNFFDLFLGLSYWSLTFFLFLEVLVVS
jgi:hypothetical protein